MGRRTGWLRALRHCLSLTGALIVLWIALSGPSDDVHAYWAMNPAQPYGGTVGMADAFLYSPVAGLAALPLHWLPFGAVRLLLLAADLACLWWLAGPWSLALAALPPVFADMAAGNIHILLGAAIVAGFRWPVAWALPLLTKVTPGIGIVWFAVRREWRSLGIAVGVTAALSALSLALVPAWWAGWLAALGASQDAVVTAPVVTDASLVLRLPMALAVVAVGAWRNQRWAVPVAALLAMPEMWVLSLSMLVGAVPLLGRFAGPVAR